VSRGLIRKVDDKSIEHEKEKVLEIVNNASLRHIKEEEFTFDPEQVQAILSQPMMLLSQEKDSQKSVDVVEQIIEYLHFNLHQHQHYPRTLRELDKAIRKVMKNKNFA